MSVSQIIALSLTEVIGDFGFKSFANGGGIVPFTIGIGGYIGVVFMLIASLQHSTVLMVNGAWDGMSGIIESLAAYIFLGERFHDPIQYLGLILILFGLYFLKLPSKKPHPFEWPKLFTAKVGTLTHPKIS